MKLKKTKNTEQKKVKTDIVIYYPYRHNFISRFIIENFFFPVFKKRHKFFIVTTKDKFPLLGYQQVLKIDQHDLPSLIQKQIQDRLYLQNNYLNFLTSKKSTPIPILISIIAILLSCVSITSTLKHCFPKPEDYFYTSNYCRHLKFENYVFYYLLKSKMPPWISYSQNIILRQSLIDKLPSDGNQYYLDWLYANGISYSPIYKDYLITQKNNSLDLSLFKNNLPTKDIVYELNYTANKLSVTLSFLLEKDASKIIEINLSPDFVLQNISLNSQKIPPGSFWQENQFLYIDTSTFSAQKNEIKLLIDSNLNTKQSSWSVYIKLPFNQTLNSQTIILKYPLDWQVTVQKKPDIARNGFLQYNLPIRGISKIDFNI